MTMNDPAQTGELSAAQLFRQHGAFVARFLYRLGVPSQAIDDAVQDVFLVVHQRGGYRPGPAKPTTYLALIASRAASAQRRQQRLRLARQGSTEPEEIQAQDGDPALRFEHRDDLCRLQDALSHLDQPLRDTLLLAEFEDETAPAIARAMGVPVGTVYWRLHEARKKFRRALAISDGTRERAAALRLPSRRHASSPASRGAKLAVVLGLPSWGEARALFQATRDASVTFDPARALQRHLGLTATLPAPVPALGAAASTSSWLARSGALKAVAWAGAASLGVLASIQLLQRTPGAGPLTNTERSARAAPAAVARAAGPAAASAEPGQRSPLSAEFAAAAAETANAHANPAQPAHASAPPNHASGRTRPTAAREPSRPSTHTVRDTTATAVDPGASRPLGAHDSAPREPTAAEALEATPPAAPPAREDPPAERSATTSAPRSPPASGAPFTADRDPLHEARALARADRLLATRPGEALAIVESLPRTSDQAYLAEERRYIEVIALYGLGRYAEANRAADQFLARYASSVFRGRVSAARKAAAATP